MFKIIINKPIRFILFIMMSNWSITFILSIEYIFQFYCAIKQQLHPGAQFEKHCPDPNHFNSVGRYNRSSGSSVIAALNQGLHYEQTNKTLL